MNRDAWCHAGRRLRGQHSIVVLGDSHARAFYGPAAFVAHVGAVTMWRLGRPGELRRIEVRWTVRHRPLFVPFGVRMAGARDRLVVSAGEIDVRCHIGRRADSGPVNEVIDELSSRYTSALAQWSNQRNSAVLALAPPPPTEYPGDDRFPVVGTLVDRTGYRAKLCAALQGRLSSTSIGYVDPYGWCTTEIGTLDPAVSDGNVHIHQRHSARLHYEIEAALGEPNSRSIEKGSET